MDKENNFLGVVWVNDIRHIVFKPELYDDTYVRDLMFMPSPTVSPGESMEDVAHKFQTSSHYNLPVIEDGKYMGFVSRANVFSEYRSMIRISWRNNRMKWKDEELTYCRISLNGESGILISSRFLYTCLALLWVLLSALAAVFLRIPFIIYNIFLHMGRRGILELPLPGIPADRYNT